MKKFSDGKNIKVDNEAFNDEVLIPFSRVEMDDFLLKKYPNYNNFKNSRKVVKLNDQILKDLDELSLDTD